MNPKDWTLRTDIGPDPHRPSDLECTLTNGGMIAKLHLWGHGKRANVLVSFSSTTTAVAARAEAHRFTAAVFDEMVELEQEAGVPCRATTDGPGPGRAFSDGREWVHVSVIGPDALECVRPYFGDALEDEDKLDGPGPGR